MLVRERVSRIYYLNKFFDYPISMKAETIRNLGLGRTFVAGCSYLKGAMFKKPETNLENFYINRFGKVLYSMFFEGYTEKLWGRHPREISADWGAQRVKGLSIRAVLKDMIMKILPVKQRDVETSLIEQFVYPKYGPGQLWEIVAAEAQALGAKLQMESEVTKIEITDGKATAVEYMSDGETKRLEADTILSTMPLKDLVLGMGDAPPKTCTEIAAGLPYRDFVTVGILVDKLHLENKTNKKTLGNIVPDCWIYVQDAGIKMGRLQIFNNWSPYLVKDPENTVWIGTEYFCEEGDDFWNMGDEDRVKFVLDELEKMDILDRSLVRDSHVARIKKAYPAYFDTYDQVDQVIDYVNSLGNVYCLGRNGQHRYNNMDHSMATAFAAVQNIVDGRKDKSNIWSVNTDAEYHESKES